MSNYTSQEENIILKNNDEITSIDLENNSNLKVLIIDNLSKLESISIYVTDGLYVSISNCEKLTDIKNSITYFLIKDNQYGSYFYLGENLKSLDYIYLSFFKTVKMSNEIFNKLSFLSLKRINTLICDFKNFPNLTTLCLVNITISNLIVDSERISLLLLSRCSFENIEIIGKGSIKRFEFNNNNYKSLKVEQSIKATHISLCNDNSKLIPYIPLSDEIDKILKFCIGVDNVYDYQYKFFIEKNSSKIILINDKNYDELTLNDMKFNVLQKKCAR